ncbi:S49 family peptidase [Sulfitobacter sp. 1A15106]|uniref:S49 family peptidase n=1 Tax=Sulfitobacter sp. 1A15106 TaxID=3368590 RepID=UPI00374618EF
MLNHVANLILNTPLLVTPDYAETILAVIGDRIGVDNSEMKVADYGRGDRASPTGGATAVIPIIGSISHRPTGINAASGVTSYATIQADIERAMSDPDVDRIMLDISSPGGMVAGAFDLRDWIMEQRGRKPMAAIARDTMASAAYLIGSATDRVYATQTAQVGSIGVVMTHYDRSAQLAKEGIKPTFIFAGSQKVAGNSAEALPDSVRAEIQEEIDSSYEMFVNAVSEARGLDPAAIKATEARVYSGAAAVEMGLADEVASLDLALKGFAASARSTYPSMSIQEDSRMENEDQIRAEGATAERARVKAILSHENAEGRGKLASHLAFNTDMTVEAAADMLAVSATEASAADTSADVDALRAEIAELKQGRAPQGQAGASAAALKEFSADAAGVAGDADADAGTQMSAEDQRREEARAAARAYFGK